VPVAENQRQIEGAEAPVRHDFNKAAVVHVNGKDRETLSFRQGSGGKWRIARYAFPPPIRCRVANLVAGRRTR
jgi:hypothetical protein